MLPGLLPGGAFCSRRCFWRPPPATWCGALQAGRGASNGAASEGAGGKTAALGGDARKRLLCAGNAPQQREGLLFLIAQRGEGFLKGFVRRLPHEFAQLLPEFLREAFQ